jgi:hypothetical protein
MKRLLLVAALLLCGIGIAFAQERKPSDDAKLILNWLLGQDAPCTEKFGDDRFLTKAQDLVLYTDVEGLEIPKGVRQVPYEFIQARLQAVRSGAKSSPAIVLTTSVAGEPQEKGHGVTKVLRKEMKNERFYYIEVGIGNMAWHRIKLVVGEKDGKVTICILDYAMS